MLSYSQLEYWPVESLLSDFERCSSVEWHYYIDARECGDQGYGMEKFEKVFRLEKEGDRGVVVFNVTGDAVNTWTDDAFSSFNEVLGIIENDHDLKGVIFISGKPNTFLAGANLRMVESFKEETEARRFAELLHSSFNRLAALQIPTVAAINGHCLGGGLEVTLACTARVARESKTTVIGLPEVNIGLLPGAGGTQRLPRLIGYPAIDLILNGTTVSAAKAYELGIVDRLVSEGGDLLEAAKRLLRDIIDGSAGLKRTEHDFYEIDEFMTTVRSNLLKKNRGREIPAPMTAMKSMWQGLKLPLREGLKNEKELLVTLSLEKQTKGTINTFFLKTMTDKPKTLMTKGFKPKKLTKAAVLGFGTMGRGITIDILRNTNMPVIVKDVPEALEPG